MGNTEEIKDLGCSYCEQTTTGVNTLQREETHVQNSDYRMLMEKVLKGEVGPSSFTEEESQRMLSTVKQESELKKENAKKFYGTDNLDFLFQNSAATRFGSSILGCHGLGYQEDGEDSFDSSLSRRRNSLQTITESLEEYEQQSENDSEEM